MSSRSLAAARARRAGEQAPPVSGTRPGTSIASHAAFAGMPAVARTNPPPFQQNPYAQQQQQQQQQQAPQMPPAPAPRYHQPAGAGAPPSHMGQQNPYMHQPPYGNFGGPEMMQPPQPANRGTAGAPKGKISISDAIGLTTIRLGKVEQWILDHEPKLYDMEQRVLGGEPLVSAAPSAAANSLAEIAARVRQLEEGTGGGGVLADKLMALEKEVAQQNVNYTRMSEKALRNERLATETKDLLKTFMIKYDAFVEETNNKFQDFEAALGELERQQGEAAEDGGAACSNVVSAVVVEDEADAAESLQGLSLADLTGEISLN